MSTQSEEISDKVKLPTMVEDGSANAAGTGRVEEESGDEEQATAAGGGDATAKKKKKKKKPKKKSNH